MARIRFFAGSFLLGMSLFVAGCADAPTAPTAPVEDPSFGLLGSDELLASDELLGSDELLANPALVGGSVSVLERLVPLAQDEVVTRTIGRDGGIIRLPGAGLTVSFPKNALRRNTEITVTAPAGNLVGYHFEPHGLEFRRSVTIVQDLSLANVLDPAGLNAVYFQGELEPEVTALESLTLWLLRSLGIFRIDHFSGYVIATT